MLYDFELTAFLSQLQNAGIASNVPSWLAFETTFNENISFVITNPCDHLDGDSNTVVICWSLARKTLQNNLPTVIGNKLWMGTRPKILDFFALLGGTRNTAQP